MALTRSESEAALKEASEVLAAEKVLMSELKREMAVLRNEIDLLNETLAGLKGELAEGTNTVSAAQHSTAHYCAALHCYNDMSISVSSMLSRLAMNWSML